MCLKIDNTANSSFAASFRALIIRQPTRRDEREYEQCTNTMSNNAPEGKCEVVKVPEKLRFTALCIARSFGVVHIDHDDARRRQTQAPRPSAQKGPKLRIWQPLGARAQQTMMTQCLYHMAALRHEERAPPCAQLRRRLRDAAVARKFSG